MHSCAKFVKTSFLFVAVLACLLNLAVGDGIVDETCRKFNGNTNKYTDKLESLKEVTSHTATKKVSDHSLTNDAKDISTGVGDTLVTYDINCKDDCVRSCWLKPGSKVEPANSGDKCIGSQMRKSAKFALQQKLGSALDCTLNCRGSTDADIDCKHK